MVSFDLKDRIAMVTGASRGIGRAIAEMLAEQGAEVIVVSRRMESLEPVAAGIREKGGKAVALAALRILICYTQRLARISADWTSW